MRIRAGCLVVLAGLAGLGTLAACAPPPGGATAPLGNGLVLAAIGDSYLSGEGAPDAAVQRNLVGLVSKPASWQDRACARSLRSGPARVAQTLHQLDPRAAARTVNMVNVACTGASLVAGILQPQHVGDGTLRPSQLDQVRQIVGKRTVDALLLDGGGNDVHFADIVTNCIIPLHDCSKDPGVQQRLRDGLAALNGPHGNDGLYSKLVDAIDGTPRAAPPFTVKDVFVTAYPDPTRNASGGPCSSAPAGDPLVGITAAEATFGSGVVSSLNQSLAAMVTQADARPLPHPRWHLIGATAPAFKDNGYCAGPTRFVNTVLDSVRLQNDLTGTVHPNAAGYAAWGSIVAGQLGYLVTRP